ncbi:MAG: agmatine deiminase family protein [Rhodospirillales bacterium]|nr:agmatine deiminase family protein [Rhodospirillales bacterium]
MSTMERPASSNQSKPVGFIAPAEESRHARTWMCWPSTASIYGRSSGYFESVQETLGRLAAAIAENEPVSMLAGAQHHDLARDLCGPNVTLVDTPTDDMWARDCAPVFVRNGDGQLGLVDFNFNGWGNKQQHSKDTRIASFLAKHRGCEYFKADIVGEGGGLEYDGDGTLILTDSCWLNNNRNPGLDRDQIELELRATLGVEKVIWVPGVRGQDITDGHIDGAIRIVRPGVLMTGGFPGDTSEWGQTLEESRNILNSTTDARGRSFKMIDIPSAEDVRSHSPDFFTGYANYYVGNDVVYTPQFGDRNADKHAQATLAKLFPDRKIVTLEMDRIYENGGGIHCVTQQEPVV